MVTRDRMPRGARPKETASRPPTRAPSAAAMMGAATGRRTTRRRGAHRAGSMIRRNSWRSGSERGRCVDGAVPETATYTAGAGRDRHGAVAAAGALPGDRIGRQARRTTGVRGGRPAADAGRAVGAGRRLVGLAMDDRTPDGLARRHATGVPPGGSAVRRGPTCARPVKRAGQRSHAYARPAAYTAAPLRRVRRKTQTSRCK